jgi:CheY-like chemotaxis protein
MKLWRKKARSHILVVDDEPGNLQFMQDILESSYKLPFARNGEKPLRL